MQQKPRLTHVAFRAHDVDATIDFYRRYVGLHVVHDRSDDGVRVVWLSENRKDPTFVLVAISEPFDSGSSDGDCVLLNHLGYDLPSREAVDTIAARGEEDGILVHGPVDAGPIVGYLCMLRDPDGSIVEFSHGQPINPKDLA